MWNILIYIYKIENMLNKYIKNGIYNNIILEN